MGKRKVVLLPETEQILETMGEQIKMARLRRRLPVELVIDNYYTAQFQHEYYGGGCVERS